LGDQSAGSHEILVGLLDVFVVDVELVFEGIEFGVVVNLPPFAVEHGVAGLGGAPRARILRFRRDFFIGEWRGLHRGSWGVVLGADHAAYKQDSACGGDGKLFEALLQHSAHPY